MQRMMWIVLMFLPASLPPATAQSVAQNAVPAIDDSLNNSQYVNKTAKFSLTLPPDWIINKEVRHGASTLAWLSTPNKQNWVAVTREPGPTILESYKEAFEASARSNLINYEKLSETPVTIDGKPAFLISYRASIAKGSNLHVAYLAAVASSGNTYTTLLAWCAEPRFQEMRPVFEKILSSYRGMGQAVAVKP
jgi:hypothetical protein